MRLVVFENPFALFSRCWVATDFPFCYETGTGRIQLYLLGNDTAWQCQAQSMFPAIRWLEDR